jgi:hypothetical protein
MIIGFLPSHSEEEEFNREKILSNTKLCTHDLSAEQVLRQAEIRNSSYQVHG